jgi:hypothetical protein
VNSAKSVKGETSVKSEKSVETVLKRLWMDPAREAAARERQAAVWRGDEPDFLPLLFKAPTPPERNDRPAFTNRECYYDPDKMLADQAWEMAAIAESGSDALPSMRTNLGCGLLATTLGARQEVFPDKMPWIVEHATKAHLSRLEPGPDLLKQGEFPRALDYARHFVERLAGRAHVYCFDTQGPFDTAHLVYGDALFTELYDDPPFVHHLLELCTYVFVEGLKAYKAVTGEPLDEAYHYNEAFVSGAGARSSEDTTTLIRPADIEVFSLPYLARAFAPFGGGYVHFCGHHPEILRMLLAMPEVRGLNFGNPECYDIAEVLPRLVECGKAYYGRWPARNGETLADYVRRHLAPLDGRRAALVLALGDLGGWKTDAHSAMALWHAVQREKG